MHRREFLHASTSLALGGTLLTRLDFAARDVARRAPAYSVIPVVGDGRWIWKSPPATDRGYLEPRPYELSIGIELEGRGHASEIISVTPVPVEYPEQKIESVEIETQGCHAQLRAIAPGAGHLVLRADAIEPKQKISAVAHFKLTLLKQYHGYERDQFPAAQELPGDVRKAYLQDSPGIQTSSKQVKQLAAELTATVDKHPWDRVQAFADWIPRNIRPQIGSYTSVTTALDTRRGDCEEMAGVFVALCRAVNIPARLVWVPNHAWAEFYLRDHQGDGHWIPVHTACYPWFGYTGVHELVLQKGDRIYVPERYKRSRLMEDWLQAAGSLPRPRYTGELAPLPSEPGADPGPGARSKDERGDWKPSGAHAADKYVRR